MAKILKSPGFLSREVPEALDRRILLAGAVAAARRRSSRRWRWAGAFSGMAAALALATVVLYPEVRMRRESPSLSGGELLEISDWSSFEQENYNLCSQLNCLQDFQDGASSLV